MQLIAIDCTILTHKSYYGLYNRYLCILVGNVLEVKNVID